MISVEHLAKAATKAPLQNLRAAAASGTPLNENHVVCKETSAPLAASEQEVCCALFQPWVTPSHLLGVQLEATRSCAAEVAPNVPMIIPGKDDIHAGREGPFVLANHRYELV